MPNSWESGMGGFILFGFSMDNPLTTTWLVLVLIRSSNISNIGDNLDNWNWNDNKKLL